MKHIKLYESFISDVNTKIEQLIKTSKEEINVLMQTLMDDYGFHFSAIEPKRHEDFTKVVSLVYDSNTKMNLNNDLIKQLLLLERKCKEYGLVVLLPHISYDPNDYNPNKDFNPTRRKELTNISVSKLLELRGQTDCIIIERMFIKICEPSYLLALDTDDFDDFDINNLVDELDEDN